MRAAGGARLWALPGGDSAALAALAALQHCGTAAEARPSPEGAIGRGNGERGACSLGEPVAHRLSFASLTPLEPSWAACGSPAIASAVTWRPAHRGWPRTERAQGGGADGFCCGRRERYSSMSAEWCERKGRQLRWKSPSYTRLHRTLRGPRPCADSSGVQSRSCPLRAWPDMHAIYRLPPSPRRRV